MAASAARCSVGASARHAFSARVHPAVKIAVASNCRHQSRQVGIDAMNLRPHLMEMVEM